MNVLARLIMPGIFFLSMLHVYVILRHQAKLPVQNRHYHACFKHRNLFLPCLIFCKTAFRIAEKNVGQGRHLKAKALITTITDDILILFFRENKT